MTGKINGFVRENYDVAMVMGDHHFPFEDKAAVRITNHVLKDLQPETIYLIGDLADFYQCSTFDKDPRRIGNLQQDLDKVISYLGNVRKLAPSADIHYSEGNHETRLTRNLKKNPELYGLRALTIPALLEFDKNEIKYHPKEKPIVKNNFMITHGDIVRKHSAYTARGMIDKKGISGISGHTHRLGSHFLTNYSGPHAWYENGSLCDPSQEYMSGKPNWQHGFSLIYFKKGSKRFHVEQIPISSGKCLVNGAEYTITGSSSKKAKRYAREKK